jgi:hypothetical protein
MKKKVNMLRKLGGFDLYQRTEDGYFNMTGLLRQWNAVPGNTRKDWDQYMKLQSTQEYFEVVVEALVEDQSEIIMDGEVIPLFPVEDDGVKSRFLDFTDIQLVKKGRRAGNKQGTGGVGPADIWVHPLVFLDCGTWINARFKVHVFKFYLDGMIMFRHLAGDNYQKLSETIGRIVPTEFRTKAMCQIATTVNKIVFGRHEKDIRNEYGTPEYQWKLASFESWVILSIESGVVQNLDGLMDGLNTLLISKQPQLTA